MRIRGVKKLDDYLSLMSDKPPPAAKSELPQARSPDHDDLKSAIRKWRAFIAKSRWTCAADMRGDAPRADYAAAPIVGFRLNEHWRVNVRIDAWAEGELDGELEILWIGKANPGSWPASKASSLSGNTAK